MLTSHIFRLVKFLAFISYSKLIIANVHVPYAWRNIDFLYPNAADHDSAIQNGSYVAGNVMLNDIDVWPDSVRGGNTGGYRIFVSTPRVTNGIPAVLSTVTNIKNGDSFLLSPFPNWEAHSLSNDCNGIISVDKIHIDRCGLLWIMDTGRINEFTGPERICQPKILIYDLGNNDNLILRYEVPNGVVTNESSLTTAVTDSRSDNCLDSIAYIADLNGNGLIVFDLINRNSWRVNHNYFYPYPRYGTFTISGVSFDLMDGIFGMALGPIRNDDRILYFHSLASVRESWVSTSALRNQELLVQRNQLRRMFSISEEFRRGQCSLEVITEDGIMIYNDLSINALMCWNTAKRPAIENTQLIYQDNNHLQFISGMKLKGDQLWIATNQVQNIIGNVTTSDHRFRIIFIKSIRTLLQNKGHKCLGATANKMPNLSFSKF